MHREIAIQRAAPRADINRGLGFAEQEVPTREGTAEVLAEDGEACAGGRCGAGAVELTFVDEQLRWDGGDAEVAADEEGGEAAGGADEDGEVGVLGLGGDGGEGECSVDGGLGEGEEGEEEEEGAEGVEHLGCGMDLSWGGDVVNGWMDLL